MKNNKTILYRIKGADFFSENHPIFKPKKGYKITVYGENFRVKDIGIEYPEDSEIPEKLIVELVPIKESKKEQIDFKTKKKFAKCVQIWDRSKGHLTEGKSYEIVRESKQKFYIIDDNGARKAYSFSRSLTQFEIED